MPNIDAKALWQTFNLTNAPSLYTGTEYSYESILFLNGKSDVCCGLPTGLVVIKDVR